MPQAQALHSSFAASFATVVPVTPSPPLRRNSSALIPGTSLQRGRYLVKDVLGKSSLGATLLATDTWREGRLVVIKELASDSDDLFKLKEDEQSFRREVAALAHINHPLIPNVTDNFVEQDRFFMVQEYVEGENLGDRINYLRAPMQEREVLTYASEILGVLDYLAHQTPPLAHHDIKPANIIIGFRDKKAHLVDFGFNNIDVVRNAKRKQAQTHMTPGYAPPEEYQGYADARSDLYALGATLHHLLTRRDPRTSQPFSYPPARLLNPRLSLEIGHVLTRVLQNDVTQRYQSAAAMKSEIDVLLSQRLGGAPDALSAHNVASEATTVDTERASGIAIEQTKPQTPRRHTGRNAVLLLMVALALFGAVYGAVIWRGSMQGSTVSANGIGVTKAADGETIGISNGTFAFDITRPDGSLKQQAATALKSGNANQAQALWQQAVGLESNDPEALIYLEDQMVLAAGGSHVTIVVATMLTGSNASVGRDDLQGAYVAQKTYNDGSRLGGMGVVLLIANAGSQSSNAPAVAHQIVQAAQADPTIIGVMGWPFSSYTTSTVNIFAAAKLPMISPTASSDLLTNSSPYFFRVCASNKTEGVSGALYVRQTMHAENVIVLTDPTNAYTSGLGNDFAGQFQVSGGTILATEKYTVGNANSLVAALQAAEKYTTPAPDVLYFSGYASDVSTLLTDLPTTGSWSDVQIMGGDALYEVGGYQSSSLANRNGRLTFTSFTDPGVWDALGLGGQKPAFFADYGNNFDPNHTHNSSAYGWERPDSDVMLSYDAMLAFFTVAQNVEQAHHQLTASEIEYELTQLKGSHAFQGVSGQISFGSDGNPVNKAIVILHVQPQGNFSLASTVEGQFLVQK